GRGVGPDGEALMSAGKAVYEDCAPRVRDMDTGKELRRLEGVEHVTGHVLLTADGTQAFLRDGLISRLWDVNAGTETRQFRFSRKTAPVDIPSLSQDGRRLFFVSADKALRLWDLEADKELRVFENPWNDFGCVALSLDGRYCLFGERGRGKIGLWDAEGGQQLCVLEGHTQFLTGMLFTQDGRRALTFGGDNTVRLWDLSAFVKPALTK